MARSVRCTACYEYGHNKRTCPEVHAHHKKVEQAMINGGYDSLAAMCRDEHSPCYVQSDEGIKIDYPDRRDYRYVEEQSRINEQRKQTPRTCSFCAQAGHNKRTCETLKQHRVDLRNQTAKAHYALGVILKDYGLVPGAMVSRKAYDYNSMKLVEQYGFITSINWQDIAEADDADGLPSTSDALHWGTLRNRVARLMINWSPVPGAEISMYEGFSACVSDFSPREVKNGWNNYGVVSLIPGSSWSVSGEGYRGEENYDDAPVPEQVYCSKNYWLTANEPVLLGEIYTQSDIYHG